MTQSYEGPTPPTGVEETPPVGAAPSTETVTAASPTPSTPSTTASTTPSTTPAASGATSMSSSSSASSTTDVAKEQAGSVGQDAKAGGRHVAHVAKEETRSVAEDAREQARDLWEQTRSELSDQAGQQQQRVADGLRSLGKELSSMAQGSGQQGLATGLAGRGADQAHRLAEYLEGRDPGSLLEEVRRFARRRPGTFLAVAAAVGVAAGRLSRGMVPERHDDESDRRTGTYGTASTPRLDAIDEGVPGTWETRP